MHELVVNVWGRDAERHTFKVNDVVALKKFKLQEYQKYKELQSTFQSRIYTNESLIPEAMTMQSWIMMTTGH